jgi:hypothetical protein
MSSVIAKRILTCVEDPTFKITVRLDRPRLVRKTGDYECSFEILGSGLKRARSAAGLDSFQALQLALSMIGAEISRIERETGRQLRFSDLPDSGLVIRSPASKS